MQIICVVYLVFEWFENRLCFSDPETRPNNLNQSRTECIRHDEWICLYFNIGNWENSLRKRKCRELDFSKKFPISHIDVRDEKAIVAIGAPHLNYQIWTHLKNQTMDGESTLISEKKITNASLTFVDGLANGPCNISYEDGV